MTDRDFPGPSSSLECNQGLGVALVGEHPRALGLALFWIERVTNLFPVSIQSCEVDFVAKRGTSEVDPHTSI